MFVTGTSTGGGVGLRGAGPAGSLAALAQRVRPPAAARTRLLPVAAPLVPLLPDGGLRRGTVVECTGEAALSLVLALAGRASAAGSWCGTVGIDDPGVVAAAGYGVDPGRLVVVRAAPATWALAAAELMGGLDLVVVRPPARARPGVVRRLADRARHHQGVLLVLGGPPGPSGWPGPRDVHLRVADPRWHGLDRGAGRLRARRVAVVALGHGAAVRPVERELWLPTATGGVAAA